jgi:hypothetical protein
LNRWRRQKQVVRSKQVRCDDSQTKFWGWVLLQWSLVQNLIFRSTIVFFYTTLLCAQLWTFCLFKWEDSNSQSKYIIITNTKALQDVWIIAKL